MSLPAFLYDPSKLRITLLLIGVVSALLAYVLHRVRAHRSGQDSAPVILLNLDKPTLLPEEKHPAPQPSPVPLPTVVQSAAPTATYTVQTLQSRPSAGMDLLRVALVILTFVVAAGFILILLPQRSVDTMSEGLQARSGAAQKQELIALLYLGDEVKDKEFHIRGVIRNITTQPIEKLDASIRLYGSDGNLLETAIVRMDKETFAPDETAQFDLVYLNYSMQFSRYAVDFKLRQGDLVPYKDMRGLRTQS
jgi:hypothetical protein